MNTMVTGLRHDMSSLVPLVIDPGSETLKAGFAGDEQPLIVCPDLVCKQAGLPPGLMDAVNSILEAEGHSPEVPCPLHVIEAPVEHGIVVDWEAMVDVLDLCFKERLAVSPSEHPVLMTESPINTNYLRERLTEIMFENFQVPAFYLKDTSSLSLLSAGLETGVVVESGDGCTYTSVVHEGHVIRQTIPKTFYAGNDVTRYVVEMLKKHKECNNLNGDIIAVAKDIKERLCFVSEDFDADLKLAKSIDLYERKYELSSGKQISLNLERLYAGESLFFPEMFGCNCPGLHKQICRTLKMCDPEIRREACTNILLSGGNTLFPGMTTRLQMEMNRALPASLGAQVLEIPNQQLFAAWIGGSRFANSEAMLDRWIYKADYEEKGAAVVNKKCKS
ncbi:actin-3-like isoform X2 [Mya arenaria]|uniref:actin-3-like isoform X2 n=1 Tax=Mya arenaria TaxID=6604 RepID=UPI0022E51E18|nr:actin-3-like isoform X2 [Mya arenaria]